jgi:acid phosphatase family membrane protein YuiD
MLADLGSNIILIISAATWAITQTLKVIIILVQEKRLDWSYFITSGGMPSSHSATVCALATSVAMTVGLASVFFSISVVLAVIVMYDQVFIGAALGVLISWSWVTIAAR